LGLVGFWVCVWTWVKTQAQARPVSSERGPSRRKGGCRGLCARGARLGGACAVPVPVEDVQYGARRAAGAEGEVERGVVAGGERGRPGGLRARHLPEGGLILFYFLFFV